MILKTGLPNPILKVKIVCTILILFPIIGFTQDYKDSIHADKQDTSDWSKVKLIASTLKVGANYTYLPLLKPEEGSIKYGNFGITADYEVKPHLWIGSGIGFSYWKFFNRTVTRVIDDVQVDPLTYELIYTYVDSVSGITKKYNNFTFPVNIRYDFLRLKNSCFFVSSGANIQLAYNKSERQETNNYIERISGPPNSFTYFSYGKFSLGYEFKQYEGFSSAISLDYRRTLFGKGIQEMRNNNFGASAHIYYDLNQDRWR